MSRAEALKDAGNKYFKNEDYTRAIKCYKEGLQVDPSNPILNCNLAQAYLAVNEFAEAEVHAVVTLAHQADSVKGFYRATKAALGMAKRERALTYLQFGLSKCPKAEELKTLYEEITKEHGNVDTTSSVPNGSRNLKKAENKEKEAHEEKNLASIPPTVVSEVERPSRSEQNKTRSRSTCSQKRNRSKSSSNVANARSTSVNNSTKLPKEDPKPEVSNKLQKDEFLDTLIKVRSELSAEEKSPQLREREALMEKQKKLQTCMKEGSEAVEIGLWKQASEKYKSALDVMVECNIEVFGLSEVDRIVLKYSLSVSWIETRNYNNIVQSIGCLNEIVLNSACELPAVYFGLGRAFHQLNRFKAALNYLDKGANLIESCSEIVPHPWPGTMKTIVETTKVGLQESIFNLQNECKKYHVPDAVCRYKECLTISSHICPSEIIFFSDPDFVGFVVILCQENCKITYHLACWKHYKENLSSVRKLTDKDVLGQPCLTNDCVNERNEISLIVRIEIYGENKELKTSCSKEPTKTDNVNENRKEKKKKNERIDLPKPMKVKKVRQIRKKTPDMLNSPKKIKRTSTISSDEFASSMQKLAALRNINFGFEEASNWNPQMNYFGRPDISALQTFLNIQSCKDSKILRERKDFIFTYFYEYLNDEGPQKISTLEKKWLEEVSQFSGINEFLSQHDGICDFLLQSYRFAHIDDYLCLTDQLTDTYKTVQEELEQSIAFILSNSSPDIDNETEDESDIEIDGFVDNSIEDSSESGFGSNFHLYDRSESRTASNSGRCSGSLLNKRDSESDSCFIQVISGSGSHVEMDFDEEINKDSENEYGKAFQPAKKFICNENNETKENLETKCLPMETVILETYPNDTPHIYDTIRGSSDSENFSNELRNINTKSVKSEISGVVEQSDNLRTCNLQTPVLKNVAVQVDNKLDLETEVINLKRENQQLNEAWKNEKEELINNFQKEREEYKQKLKVYECKLNDKETHIKNIEQEIEIKNSKVEALEKKYQEEVNNLSKSKEDHTILLKKTLESLSELNKIVEKQTGTKEHLEAQLRKANEQILNLRKQFGEYKLNRYLEKCQERLHCMNTFITLFEEAPSDSISDIKTAAEAWKSVERELQENKDLLEVQFDILCQQLKSKVSSDSLFQLELAVLPKEPFYPFQDVNNILHLAVEYGKMKNPSEKAKIIETTRNNRENVDYAAATPSPLLSDAQSYQLNGNLYGARSSNAYGPPNAFRPPFYTSHFNAFSRPMTMSPTGHNFNPYQSNQSMNAMGAGTWPSGSAFISDKMGLNGNNFFEEIATTSAQTSLRDQSDTQIFSKINDRKGPAPLTDLNVKDGKKGISSSTAGLTPIETKESGVADTKGVWFQILKPTTSETKQTTKHQQPWNYQKLLDELQKYFKLISEAELSECLSITREKNGNKLSGLSVIAIIRNVDKILEDRSSKKIGNMGMDKFGGTAWGEVKKGDVSWQNDDDPENECIICHVTFGNNKTSLQCKHTFHTECIRKWLNTNSTCPICRKYTRLDDEFPPLG